MQWDWRRLGAIGVALISLVGAAGCPDSDVIQSGTGALALEIRLDNNNTRFDSATFTIFGLRVRPQNPEADGALGNDIRVLRRQVFVDFTNPILPIPTLPLSAGVYEITRLELRDFLLFDFDPPASTATCEDFVSFFDGFGAKILLTNVMFPGTLTVTVEPGGETQVVLAIDVEAFVTAFTGSHVCQQNCGGLAWCTVGFDEPAFVAETPTYLSLE